MNDMEKSEEKVSYTYKVEFEATEENVSLPVHYEGDDKEGLHAAASQALLDLTTKEDYGELQGVHYEVTDSLVEDGYGDYVMFGDLVGYVSREVTVSHPLNLDEYGFDAIKEEPYAKEDPDLEAFVEAVKSIDTGKGPMRKPDFFCSNRKEPRLVCVQRDDETLKYEADTYFPATSDIVTLNKVFDAWREEGIPGVTEGNPSFPGRDASLGVLRASAFAFGNSDRFNGSIDMTQASEMARAIKTAHQDVFDNLYQGFTKEIVGVKHGLRYLMAKDRHEAQKDKGNRKAKYQQAVKGLEKVIGQLYANGSSEAATSKEIRQMVRKLVSEHTTEKGR